MLLDASPNKAHQAISLVIPVRDEADNVLPLFKEICAVLEPLMTYEVIFVDDGSNDDTARRLSNLAARAPQLRLIRHRVSCGQSTALSTGVRAARHPLIVTLDGDGQNDPADIPNLVAIFVAAEAPLHLVCGYRRNRQDTWLKRISSRIANGVRSSFLRDNTPDTGCGLKLFPKATFLALPYFDHMHRFLPALVRRAGGQIVSVEVHHRPRTRGRSNYGLHDRLWTGIVDMLGVMWLMRRSRLPVIVDTGDKHDA